MCSGMQFELNWIDNNRERYSGENHVVLVKSRIIARYRRKSLIDNNQIRLFCLTYRTR